MSCIIWTFDKSSIQKSRFVVPIESIRFEMTKRFLEVVWYCFSSHQNVPSSFPSKTRKHMPKGIVMQLAKGTFQLGETTWETISTSKVSRPISCKVSKAKEWNQSTKNPHQKPARLLGFLSPISWPFLSLENFLLSSFILAHNLPSNLSPLFLQNQPL